MPEKKLTALNNDEAKAFLQRYEAIIYAESHRRSQLTGMDADDLMQECRFKLLGGYHQYDKERGSERNWAISVIKKRLDGIWKHQLRDKRVPKRINRDGDSIPIRSLTYGNGVRESQEFEYGNEIYDDTYTGKYAGPYPIFGTTNFSQDEHLEALSYLKLLKSNLPKESYSLIRDELLPDLEEQIPITVTRNPDHVALPLENFPIYSKVGSAEEEKKVQILSQIAEFFVNVLEINLEKIIKRTKTNDIKILDSMKIAV